MKTKEDTADILDEPNTGQVTIVASKSAPLGFKHIVGQGAILQRLAQLMQLTREKGEVFRHTLFVGAEGCGKKTIARALAIERGVALKEVQAWAIDRAGDLAALVSGLEAGDMLLFDTGRIRKPVIDVLCGAMRTFELNISVGKGSGARVMPLAIRPFTCIGIAERLSVCDNDLVKSFEVVMSLQPYTQQEMTAITERFAKLMDISIEPSATELIAKVAGGNPGRAKKLVQQLTLSQKRPVTETEAREILSAFGHSSAGSAGSSSPTLADLANLSGVEFEQVVVTLLRDLGFTAEMTRATGDGGIDIEAMLDRPIVGGRYLIQCKRFAPDTLVGSPTVREFYGALVADRRAIKGILITTSNFSAQAREFAANLPIELIDGDRLGDLLTHTKNDE